MSQDPDITTLGDIWSVLDESRPLTRREQFAMAVLPALYGHAANGVARLHESGNLSNLQADRLVDALPSASAKKAVSVADALIAALDGEESGE